MQDLTHLDAQGQARMVDVGDKPATSRRALATATLVVGEAIAEAIRQGNTPKGNVFEVARIAGITAAKRTADLIPLCHQLPLEHVAVDFQLAQDRIHVKAEVRAFAKTGVEMEALTAVAVAALTLYDMLKAAGKGMVLENLRLERKEGGKSGLWQREDAHAR
jgi:cyclic pyranopterin phosphate synthase